MATVLETLAKVVIERGGTDVFTLMSDDTAELVISLDAHHARIISTRHENGAVGAADGYARASGRVGTAIIGRGPGLTNAANSLITALKAHSGVVVIVGHEGTATNAIRFGKDIRQTDLLDALAVPHVPINNAATASADMVAAYKTAMTGTPVVVSLGGGVLRQEAGDAPSAVTVHVPKSPSTVALEDVADVCDLLETEWACRKPVILAGNGAVASKAGPALGELSARIGAVLGTTLPARSYFKGNELDIGIVGTFSSQIAGELLTESDVIVAFGASLNENTTYGGTLFSKARIVHIDNDPEAANRYAASELFVCGDAAEVAQLIVDELARRGHTSRGFRDYDAAERLATYRNDFKDQSELGALDPRALMRILNEVLPEMRNVVVDPGHHFAFGVPFLEVTEPRAFVAPLEYGAVGSGMGPAIGMAIARPHATTILSIGDGGFMMTLGDFDTAIRYKLPLIVIVNDDGGFGSEVQYLRVNGLPDELALYENPSFAAVARALGAESLTLSSLDDLTELKAKVGALSGPLVLDCKTSRDVKGDWVDFYYGRHVTSSED